MGFGSAIMAVGIISMLFPPLYSAVLIRICLGASAALLSGYSIVLLIYWNRLITVQRISDSNSISPLHERLSEMISFHLTLLSMIEAIVLAMLIIQLGEVSGGRYFEGWTLALGLQFVVMAGSILTIWVVFMTDLLPVRRVINSIDLIGLIALGILQMVGVQSLTLSQNDVLFFIIALFGIGGALIRSANYRAALSDRVARGIVKLYPQRIVLILLGSLTPFGLLGAFMTSSFPMLGYLAICIIILILLSLVITLLLWWDKIISMRRIR